MIQGFAVADFPTYRRINDKLFLCRPITNILGIPLIIIANQRIIEAIDERWTRSVQELLSFTGDTQPDFEYTSIANTLPGKNKMSEEALNSVKLKTKQEIDRQR